ncbi:MAG: Rpn family recombination-promoting nuclease/putative transposase [Gemmatimonadetes bacterium]|nr:Rpn family recombination-promoting nuclease/putative transposase [Gemmatimonadota bacterium]
MSSPESRRHDQSYKLLFSIPLAVDQLTRHFLDASLADELDFKRVEILATERVSAGLVRSHADLLWKIHFRGSRRHLLLAIEFQSAVDRYMTVRVHHYVVTAYHGMTAAKAQGDELAPGGGLPPTLAVTIYNGKTRWTAARDILELIDPVYGWLAARQPGLRHEVLDLRDRARHPLPKANVVSWIASLELDPSPDNVSRVVHRVLERYPGAKHARLREAFREWVLGAAASWGIGEEVLEEVKSLKEAEMIYAGVEELKEQYRERSERARVEGRAEGRAAIVCRLARLKFGAETAEPLSRLLEGVADPERIARIGDRIIECETGVELLASVRRTVGPDV